MILLGIFSLIMILIAVLMIVLCIAAKEADLEMMRLFYAYEYNKLK